MIELMITLSIVAIMATVGVPAIGDIIQKNRLRSQSGLIIDSISVTRSEAVKRRQAVVMCRTGNPTSATPSCGDGSAANTWTTGWLVFVDSNGNSTYQAPDILLNAVNPSASGNVTIMTSGNADNNLSYNSDGTLNEAGTARFAVCDARGINYGRGISVALVGRASIFQGTPTSPLTSCTAP